jgi:RimJ/RimL family protein N-acetyltransferase
VTLTGHGVTLEPLEARHLDELAAGMDAECWQWGPITPGPLPSTPAQHRAWLEAWYQAALANTRAGSDEVFVVRRHRDGAAVGSTRYLAIVPSHKRLEIGGTFYRADARGTLVNPACKRLLLARAFDERHCNRVELKCDLRNARSAAGIRKIGAKEEGVFRSHMVLGDGWVRDTLYFSIIAAEWPSVRTLLDERLASAG